MAPTPMFGYGLNDLRGSAPTLFGSLWQVTLGKFLIRLGQEFSALLSVGGGFLHFCVLLG